MARSVTVIFPDMVTRGYDGYTEAWLDGIESQPQKTAKTARLPCYNCLIFCSLMIFYL
ncbi:hypothetical protein ACSSVV_000059 [Marinobacter sp. MBR-105]